MVRERAGEFGLCFGAARNERRRIRGSSDPRTYRPYFRTLKDPVVVNTEKRSDEPFLHRGCCENLHRLPCCFLTAQRSWAAGLGYTFSGTTKGARYSRVSSWLAC